MQAHRKRTHLLLHFVHSLPLDLVHEIEVTLVEVVNSHVAVLSAACVALTVGVGGDGVEGTEVATHTADLVLEDLVVEAGLELTLTGRGTGDVHGGLTTTEDHEVLLRGDGGAVEGSVADVGLENFEVRGGDELEGAQLARQGGYVLMGSTATYLGGLVLGGGNEVGAVSRPLQVDDGLVEFVDGEVVEQVTSLGIILADAAVLVAGDDVLAEVAPAGDGGLALVCDDGEDLLVALLGVDVGVDVHDDDVAQVSHTLLGDTQQLGAVLVELDALDGRGELPDLEAAASLDLPEADGVVGRAGGDHGRGGVDIDGPDGTDMAVVGAETLAVVGEPDTDLLILGDGEDQVAIEVVSADGGVSRELQARGERGS